MTEVPVIPCDDWTDAQVKAFRLLVNRSVTWADWDTELLSLELLDLKELNFDLALTGFDGGEIDALLLGDEPDATEDVVPDLPENAVTVPGDLWLLGPHRRDTAQPYGNGSAVWSFLRPELADRGGRRRPARARKGSQ